MGTERPEETCQLVQQVTWSRRPIPSLFPDLGQDTGPNPDVSGSFAIENFYMSLHDYPITTRTGGTGYSRSEGRPVQVVRCRFVKEERDTTSRDRGDGHLEIEGPERPEIERE